MDRKEMLEGVAELKNWLSTQPHLPPSASEDELLEAFTVSCRSVDLAKLKLDAYFSLRYKYQNLFFKNRDPNSILWPSIQKHFLLPGPSEDGDLTFFTLLPTEKELESYSSVEAAKVNFMLLDSCLKEYHDKSYRLFLITDMRHLSMRAWSGIYMKHSRIINEIMEAYPLMIKGMLMFNALPNAEKIIKSCYNKEVQERIFVSHDDYESVSKFIPIKMLPRDYLGGKNFTIKELTDGTRQRLERERQWFLSSGSEVTNEKLRP